MQKLSQLEAKHKSLIMFVNKTLNLFQSYIEYNQHMSWEFEQLKQYSQSFQSDLGESNRVTEFTEDHDAYEPIEDMSATTQHNYDSINKQIMVDEWGEQVFDNQDSNFETYYEEDEAQAYQEDAYPTTETNEITEQNSGDFNYEQIKPEPSVQEEPDMSYSMPPPLIDTPTSSNRSRRPANSGQEVKIHQCSVCSYSTKRESDLKLHTRIHTGERPFRCAECDMRFVQSSHLIRHRQKVHGTSNKLKCTKCDYTCTLENNLKVHERGHTGKRPFECSECDMSFASSSSLRVHERVHTGERPYKCNQCDKTFSVQSNLSRHVNMIHKKT